MSDSRRRARDTTDDESEPPTRVVTPRRSNTPEPTEPTEREEETEPSEDSNEEPFEDEEESHPILSSSPPAVPSSPTIPSSPNSNSRPATEPIWDWMPKVLDWWRRDEQIPKLPVGPGPETPIPTYTQEPVHLTVPVLVTRLLSHEKILERLEKKVYDRRGVSTEGVEHLQQQISGVESELSEMRDDVVTTHTKGVELSEEVEALRQRALSAEDRAEAAQNRAERLEERMNAMQQEIIELRADRDQLRTATVYSTRLVDRLEGLCERLR